MSTIEEIRKLLKKANKGDWWETREAAKDLIRMVDERNRVHQLEMAWVIIANAGGGNWDLESKEWQEAAKKWRDEYHKNLNPPGK